MAFLIWGLLTIYWKHLRDFQPLELIAWRVTLSAATMAVVVAIRGRVRAVARAFADPETRWRLVVAAVLLTGNWTSYVWTIVNERVLESALGYFIAPIATMVLGVTVLGERLSTLARLALALGTGAVIVIAVSYGQVPWAALIIAGSWSLYGLVKRHVAMASIDSFAAESFVLVVPALVTVAFYAGRAGSIPADADAVHWTLLALSGVATAVPLVLFAFAAPRVPFTLLGPIQYLVPLINFVLGWAIYHEALPPSRIVGFTLVWLALAAVTFDRVHIARSARIGETSPVPVS